ncbi:hypothetical protein CKF54_05160 [Psittacicella hinzii]|uniref:TonB-dependent receptor n=1 Tax=Psittacicella hinzii TaxID=2028575 RepID=A0A3A1Y4S8_9GAMM|nr:TonB-dependent receptor [Psittacicella hinzii]RIY32299.1 hypothetical protein CKF54_05160 [Psittacicella hinzii]
MRMTSLALGMMSLGFSAVALAEGTATNLTTIVVTGTQTTTSAIPGKTNETVDASLTLRNFVTNVPGVTFNLADNNVYEAPVIRGIGGMQDDFGVGTERVGMSLDGIPLPFSYKFGHDDAKGLNYFDTANLKGFEVYRGPTFNNSFTNLAGHLSLKTIDPEDVLLANRSLGAQTRLSYDDRYETWMVNNVVAFKSASTGLAGLVSYTRRNEHEAQVEDPDIYAKMNKFRVANKDIFAKLRWDINEDHRLTLSGGKYESTYLSEAKTARFSAGRGWQSNANERWYFSLSGEHFVNTFFADKITWLYGRQSASTALDVYNYNPLFMSYYMLGTVTTTQKQKGQYANLALTKLFNLSQNVGSRLEYGVSWSQDRVSHVKDNKTQLNLPVGSSTTANAVTYFPPTTLARKGVFASNRFTLKQYNVAITPSVKYDALRANADYSNKGILEKTEGRTPGYVAANPTKKYNAWSWGLNLDWQATEKSELSFMVSQATRLPSFTELFPSTYFHWEAVPNPNLAPERATSYSLSWAFNGDYYKHNLTLSHTRFKNMIDLACANVTASNECTAKIMVNNDDPTVINAIEYTGAYELAGLYKGLKGWSVSTTLAWAKGKNTKTGEGVSRVVPFGGNFNLSYRQENFNTFLRLNFNKAKKSKYIGVDPIYGGYAAPVPGWATLDYGFYLTPNERLTIGFMLYNLLDKTYQTWESVGDLHGTERDNYWQPNRSFAINLSYKF